MSTLKEKIQAIKHAVEAARRRESEIKNRIHISRAETFELDMCRDCIARGEKMIREHESKLHET